MIARAGQERPGGQRDPPDTIVFGAKDNGIWGAQGTHRYHCLWRQRQWYLEGTFCKSYRILSLQRALLRRTLGGAGGRLVKSMDFGEKLQKNRFFGISVEQIWVRKTITRWTPFPDRVISDFFRYIRKTDLARKKAARSPLPIRLFFAFFPQFSVYPESRFGSIFGGARAKRPK